MDSSYSGASSLSRVDLKELGNEWRGDSSAVRGGKEMSDGNGGEKRAKNHKTQNRS